MKKRRSCIILLRRDWSFMKCTGLMTRKNFGKFISYLEQRFTKEQIESAFQILQAYSDYHMQMDEFK